MPDSLEMQIDDANRVMSDNDVLARRAQMNRLADLNAEFMKFWTPWKDRAAALANEFEADALLLADMEEAFRLYAGHTQKMIRLHYARRYVP